MYTTEQQSLIDALEAEQFADYDASVHVYIFNHDTTAVIGYVQKEQPNPARVITPTDLMDRFHQAELDQIYVVAKTEVKLQQFIDRLLADKNGINLDSDELRTKLVTLGSYITYEQPQAEGKTRVDELLS